MAILNTAIIKDAISPFTAIIDQMKQNFQKIS